MGDVELESIDLGMCRGTIWRGGSSERLVVGLPGAFAVGAPALIFCLQALVRRGWTAVQVNDEYYDSRRNATDWVVERANAALASAAEPEHILVVAKSLSTRASGLVADLGYPAVWLTPLLNDQESVNGLRRRRAPALLVGGTADPAWDGELAHAISDDVLELEGVDHGFGRPGDDPLDTLDNLKQVVQAVTTFAAQS